MSKIIKALVEDYVAVTAANTIDIVNDAIEIHSLSPSAAAALGRALTVCAIMTTSLKNETDRLSATISGGGPLGVITVCGSLCGVKGCVGNADCPTVFKSDKHLDIGAAVGNKGKLTVVKNTGLKQPYVGTVNLVSGEIAEDFTRYFAVSEQRPSAVSLGVKLKDGKCHSAGGILVEILPGCGEELLNRTETAAYAMDELSYMFDNHTPEEVIKTYFGGFEKIEFVGETEICYKCDCTRERIDEVLLSLGKTEADEILDEHGKIEFTCHFCNKNYVYNKEETEALFASAREK